MSVQPPDNTPFIIIITPPSEESHSPTHDPRVTNLAVNGILNNTPLVAVSPTDSDFSALSEEDDILNFTCDISSTSDDELEYSDSDLSPSEAGSNSDPDIAWSISLSSDDESGSDSEQELVITPKDTRTVVVNSYPHQKYKKIVEYRPSSRVPTENVIQMRDPKRSEGSWVLKKTSPEERYQQQLLTVSECVAKLKNDFNPDKDTDQNLVRDLLGQRGYPQDVLSVVRVMIKVVEILGAKQQQ